MRRRRLPSILAGMLLLLAGCGGGTEQPECDEASCSGHGECDDSGGELVCACHTGYRGDRCEGCAEGFHDDGTGTCVADETCQPGSCSGHGPCDDGTGVVVCTCEPGYAGDACERCDSGYHDDGTGTCAADETCQPDSCSGHGQCGDATGAVVCTCDAGYQGVACEGCAPGYSPDGSGNCLPDVTCQPDSCAGHGQCDDATGAVVCTCDAGYQGVACEGCAAGYQPDGSGNCILDEVRIVGGVVVHEITPNAGGDNPTTRLSTDQIYDRPFPGHVFGVINWRMFEVTLEAGDCVYYTEIEDCPTPCGADQWCTPADVCEPLPVHRHAGTLTLEGLSVPASLSPDADGRYGMTYLPPDVFQQGDTITLHAAGGETPAFTLSTPGVEDVEPAFSCDLGLQAGQDLIITWTPSTGPGFIRFEMFTYRHAGHGPMVLCETEDVGSLTVPAAIVDRYLLDQTAEDSYALSRVSQATVEVDNGNSVALAVMASRICWNAP